MSVGYKTRRGVLQVRRWNERPGHQEVDFGAATFQQSGAATLYFHWRTIDHGGGASWGFLGNRGGMGNLWNSLSVQESVMRTVRGWLNLEIFPLGSNGSIRSFGRHVVIFNVYLY